MLAIRFPFSQQFVPLHAKRGDNMKAYSSVRAGIVLAATMVFSANVRAQAPGAPAVPAVAAPEPPAEIEVGRVAPDFTMQWADATGVRAAPVKLSDLRGKVVVLAFYPGDRTSGCTAELTKFRDEYATLFGKETVVVPISGDSLESHVSWSREMKFPFALGADDGLAVAKQYGSWIPGRTSASRTVFVIGKDGRILWRNLKFPALSENAYIELAAEVAKAQ
jgi:peroxiredoxin Q/BCP